MVKRIISLFLTLLLTALLLPGRVEAVNLELPAPSALLMDQATGTVLYESNAHERLAPASVTKVMTMLLVMEAVEQGKIRWEDMVTASEAAAAKGGSQVYLRVGEQMTVEEMMKSVAVASANDCACALAEHIAGSEPAFVDRMNTRAGELGMEDTHFVNCTGLDDGADAAEHRTTAYDIALMSRALLGHREIRRFTTIWMDTVRNGAFGLANTNKLVRFYEGTTGLKTGYTSGAGYCLSASAERDGMELIAVVMHCKTPADRYQSVKAMLDYGFANYALISCAPQEPITPVPVILGTQQSLMPVPDGILEMLVDKGQREQVERNVTLDPSVTAPVRQGQRLGMLTVRAGGETLCEIPLVAAESVPRVTWKALAVRILRAICMGGGADET